MVSIQETLAQAVAHHQAGRLQEAEWLYRQVLEVAPDHPEAVHLLGLIAHQCGNHAAAVPWLEHSIRLNAQIAYFHSNLGEVYRRLGRTAEAVHCFQRALALDANSVEAMQNLGLAMAEQGNTEEAVACYQRAIQISPGCAGAYNNLGILWHNDGRLEEAVACFDRAMALKPDFAQAHSNSLCVCHYRPEVTLAELHARHLEYDRRQAAPLRAAWRPHDNATDARRPLRLGFVSRDFRRHPVGYFLVGVLENLDRRQCEAVCYCDWLVADPITARLRAAAAAWRDVLTMTDEQLAGQIRADRIDVLFDLAGHTISNRLPVFARKPAPVQITWAGYVGTTGLAAMDYLLADRFEVPPEAEPYYVERVLRMPDGYVCYEPPDYAPAVGPLPALASGQATFGCFNHTAKINWQVAACWSRILHRLPQSRLVLKYRGGADRRVQDRLRGLFAEQGIPWERVELLGESPHDEFLGWYRRIDIALDPFPYSGGLTTCESLWMGVPVMTCPGETFASRHSLSHLSNVGLTETIARDLDEYVDLAVSLAGDLRRLASLRASLRERMAQSPLCDGKRFAANLTEILIRVWNERVQTRG